MRKPVRSLIALLASAGALSTCALGLGAAPAQAGSYTVHQCDYALGISEHDFLWHASGIPGFIQYPGSNCGEFGLALRNGNPGHEQTYPSGGYSGYFAYAPIGTVFTRFSGMFGNFAWCCINGAAAYAEATQNQNGSGGVAYLFQGNLGNDTFGVPSGVGGPVGRSWSATSFEARRVGFQIRCGPGFSCPQWPYGEVRLRGRSFQLTLRDYEPPSLGGAEGTLAGGGWMRGSHSLAVAGGDTGGGVAELAATFDNGTRLSSPSPCSVVGGRYVRLQPCPLSRSVGWTVDTAKLPDGARTLTMSVRDVGGETAAHSRQVLVDNTPPAAPLTAFVEGGAGWRRTNGFAVDWTNPSGQHAPIAKARFRACPVGGGECVAGERAGDGIARIGDIELPRAGEWDLLPWLEDAAGNSDGAAHAPGLRLRFDPDPPALRFLPRSDTSPAAVVVEASDISGLASGRIELRRRGWPNWKALPTTLEGRTLRAAIDDAGLARDVYDLRASAVDLAGNATLAIGPARLLPLRASSRLTARIRVERTRRCRCGPSPLRRAAKVRRGARVTVVARLTAGGLPLPRRALSIALESNDRTRRSGGGRTDLEGGLLRSLRARRSAVVRVAYAGDGGTLPATARVALRVPARTSIRTSRHPVFPGGAVAFRGRIAGGAIPAGGKLVELQAHFRDRWRTISTGRSRRDGRWRFGYAFGSHGGGARYRFRVRVPRESGHPFATGVSKPVRVTVLGR